MADAKGLQQRIEQQFHLEHVKSIELFYGNGRHVGPGDRLLTDDFTARASPTRLASESMSTVKRSSTSNPLPSASNDQSLPA
jgi:hypothetical protein